LVDEVIDIRRASYKDAQMLAELSAVTFFDTFKDTCTGEDMQGFIKTYFSIKQIEKELRNLKDFYFVGYINNKAVGYLRLKEEKSEVVIITRYKSIELKRIYVSKEYHDKKVGAALMNFALNFAAEKNFEIVWLGVWEHNERAKKFYERFGFEDTGVKHPFPIGNTPQTDGWLYKFIKP
jgi:ribosomal protein S18 acetylase RimI-like enzyme